MYWNFISIFFFVSMAFSLKLTTPKFCVNCKYFLPSEGSFPSSPVYGKCLLFNQTIITADETYLVTGVDNSEVSVEYNYCSTARKFENMCGIDGKRYVQK